MKRVLILTQPLHNNYGGLLQAYALQKVVKGFGLEVVTNKVKLKAERIFTIKHILNYCISKAKRVAKTLLGYSIKTPKKMQIISQYTSLFISKFITTENVDKITEKVANDFDIFIVGSDQVFRRRWSNVTQYFLKDLRERNDKIKIAYAASFGTDDLSEWSEKEISLCKSLAPKFKAISVREDSGVEIFKKYFDTNAELVLDPTLLLEKDDYIDSIDSEDSIIKSNILMCYVLDKTPEKTQIINHIKDKMGLSVLEVMPEEIFNKHTKDITKCIFPSVSKWLAGFRDAQFVVTDSFHGTVFSIIFNKPFICIANKMRGLSRFTSLLKIFGLEERLVCSTDGLSELLLKSIDFEKVNAVKQEWRKKSLNFLKDNLG